MWTTQFSIKSVDSKFSPSVSLVVRHQSKIWNYGFKSYFILNNIVISKLQYEMDFPFLMLHHTDMHTWHCALWDYLHFTLCPSACLKHSSFKHFLHLRIRKFYCVNVPMRMMTLRYSIQCTIHSFSLASSIPLSWSCSYIFHPFIETH